MNVSFKKQTTHRRGCCCCCLHSQCWRSVLQEIVMDAWVCWLERLDVGGLAAWPGCRWFESVCLLGVHVPNFKIEDSPSSYKDSIPWSCGRKVAYWARQEGILHPPKTTVPTSLHIDQRPTSRSCQGQEVSSNLGNLADFNTVSQIDTGCEGRSPF